MNESLWSSGLSVLNCTPESTQLAQLKQYVELLSRWNKTYNLTSVRNVSDMIPLHVFDSLVVADLIQGKTCLDVGSGAGLPTIPLAIIQPDRMFTALDTNGKKTRFIQQAVIDLGLKNVSVEQVRVENWQPEEKFDAIISRAFASIFDFVSSSSAHLADGGVMYAMKGQYPASEMQYLPKEFIEKQKHQLTVPHVDAARHLIEITRNEVS